MPACRQHDPAAVIGRARRWASLVLILVGACSRDPGGDDARRFLYARATTDAKIAQEAMGAGTDPSFSCALVNEAVANLRSDPSISRQLLDDWDALCHHDAPLAFAKARVARMEAQKRAPDNGFVDDCLDLERALSLIQQAEVDPELADLQAKYKKLCP